jgi:hypothetical protein
MRYHCVGTKIQYIDSVPAVSVEVRPKTNEVCSIQYYLVVAEDVLNYLLFHTVVCMCNRTTGTGSVSSCCPSLSLSWNPTQG